MTIPTDLQLNEHDEACLKMKVPMSEKPWLNEIIKEGRRLDFLQAVFTGLNDTPKDAAHSTHQADEHLLSRMLQEARRNAYDLFDKTP